MRLSSANSLTDDPIFSLMSLIYSKNINGSNTVPCGTPDLTLTDPDSTKNVLRNRNHLNLYLNSG